MIPVTPEQLGAASEEAGWEVSYNQLARGVMHGEFLQAEGQHVIVSSETYTHAIHGVGSAPPDKLAFVIQMDKGHSRLNGIVSCASKVFLLPAGREFDYFASKNHNFFTIQVDQGSFTSGFHKLRGSNDTQLDFESWSYVSIPRPLARALNNHICQLLDQVPLLETATINPSAEESELSISHLLSLSFLSNEQVPFESNPSERRRRIQSAKDFILSNLGSQLSIPEICAIADCSVRTLQYGFLEHYNLTPVQFIKYHRINEARRQLIAASADEQSVGQIARSLGLKHQGRFSEDYREMFGELPSQTLRPF